MNSGQRLLLLSTVCVALYLGRVMFTGELRFLFLSFNLALAWIPWTIASGLEFVKRPVGVALVGALWLLFFPNSFYLITDLTHLGGQSRAPAWFDPALFAAFALTGALLAVDSLAMIERALQKSLGKFTPLVVVSAAIVASSFGIWLGRVRRWNSWDVVAQPQLLGRELAHIAWSPPSGAVAATAVYSVLLGAVYLYMRPLKLAERD